MWTKRAARDLLPIIYLLILLVISRDCLQYLCTFFLFLGWFSCLEVFIGRGNEKVEIGFVIINYISDFDLIYDNKDFILSYFWFLYMLNLCDRKHYPICFGPSN